MSERRQYHCVVVRTGLFVAKRVFVVVVPGVSASSAKRWPVAVAFFILSLVLLIGLVALLFLCKYCVVLEYYNGSEFQQYYHFICPC